MSSDQQAVVHMNKLLALDEVADPKPETTDAVVEVLIKNGYSDDLTTNYSDYKLAWLKEHNAIVLVKNDTVVYPEKYAGESNFEELKPMVKDVEELFESLQNGETVFVSEDIITDGLSADIAGEYTVNLNGNKLESEGCVGSWTEGSKLVISNGTIDSNVEGTAVLAKNAGLVELTNIQVCAPSGANPIQCYGGTMILNNVTTSQSGSVTNGSVRYNSAIQIINQIKKIDEGKYVVYGQQAELIVNSGMYSGKRAIQISAPGGNVTINGGNFIGAEYVINGDFNPQSYIDGINYESVIIINDGTFDRKIKIFAATVLIINGGTFTINQDSITTGQVRINGTVIDNGNGTWTVKYLYILFE